MRRLVPAAFALLPLACLFGGNEGLVRVTDSRPAMGTLLDVTLYAETERAAEDALEISFALAADLETIFTSYDPASPLNRLNAEAGLGPVSVPGALSAILQDARALGGETRGAFDVTVGPLIGLWRDAERDDRIPSDAVVDAVRRKVDVAALAIDGQGRVDLPRGSAVNLGGLAKGWALDRIEERLRARGVEHALLSFGGSSVLALGTAPGEGAWNVLIRSEAGTVIGVVSLRDRHLSVSESLGQSSTIGDRRFGHVIDPRSGWPIEAERLAAAVSTQGARAEAWSTALLILPLIELESAFGSEADTHAITVDDEGRATLSSGFTRETAFRADP